MKKFFSVFFCFLFCFTLQAQIISGPMLGQVELRDAKIWLEVSSAARNVKLVYNKKGSTQKTTLTYKGELGNSFNPIQFVVGGLELNTTYQYQFWIDGKLQKQQGEFTTKELWQYRKPVPDFSFITGSCSFFNEPLYDRPTAPYGKDSSIFETMAKEKAAFMLWLGDVWYTREVDYYSEWGLWYRAHRDRKLPVLQNFLKAMPHYAIWDDHDYGPNDIGSNYILKETSKEIFKKYWANPSYGERNEGVYTMLSYGDADFFLCDDRWWRSDDKMKDSINGKPDPQKTMLGEKQMSWLKNSLLYSRAPFKFIVIGSQVLNPVSPYNKLGDFSFEYSELMNFLKDNAINGVLFLTGDRHHSEVIKVDRQGTYSLYDITVSPLTSGTHAFHPAEVSNPYRVFALTEKQNYARFNFSGAKDERKLVVEFIGIKGKLGEWSITEKELQ
ncbi:MAG TPA: alkaline phosphatase D family protein [Chitinophagaceae bacterium]|nr:alkaline phosphatase D family protein [Chitinophagaceae bacterium]